MISSIVSRLVILVFGTLYPAYASYKAVRTKNVKEYVKWMMYWIVFALFTCAETFTDVFFSFWFPFYYEFKVILVLWLLSPATKGSSILYRKFVHPMLTKREQEIDEYISRAKEQGYHTVLTLGTKGVNYATSVIMQTAIKNLPTSLSTSSLLPIAPANRQQTVLDDYNDAVAPRLANRKTTRVVDEPDYSLERDMPSLSAFSDDEELHSYKPSKSKNNGNSQPVLRNRVTRSAAKTKSGFDSPRSSDGDEY